MCAGYKQVLHRIFVFRRGALDALASTALCAIGARWRSFDVATVADGNDHRLFGDQIFQVNVAQFLAGDLGPSLVAILAANFLQIVFDDGQNVLFVGENSQVLGDFGQ